MQQLSFPLKVHIRRNGKRVIFVEHVHLGRWPSDEERQLQDDTRHFCKWLRSTFPDLPTEFRATYSGWSRYHPNRHFVAYDLTPKEFMMVKLAFSFETVRVVFSREKVRRRAWWGDKAVYFDEVYTPGFMPRSNLHPTPELLARMAKAPGRYRKLTRNRQK